MTLFHQSMVLSLSLLTPQQRRSRAVELILYSSLHQLHAVGLSLVGRVLQCKHFPMTNWTFCL